MFRSRVIARRARAVASVVRAAAAAVRRAVRRSRSSALTEVPALVFGSISLIGLETLSSIAVFNSTAAASPRS